MNKRELEDWCKQSGMMALEALLEASDEIVKGGEPLEGDDLCELKMVWETVAHIKTVFAMDAGGQAIQRFMR